jgi:ABC-type sugar transport system permease subunit
MNVRKKYALAGFLFVLPSFIYYLFIFLYPLGLSFVNSFSKVNFLAGTRLFVGLDNYRSLFLRSDFWQAVGVTGLYVVMTVPLLIVVALWVANALAKFKGRGGLFLTTIVFLPFIVSMVSAGMIWDWLFDPNLGLINSVLRFAGVQNPPSWLRSPDTALWATVVITLWIRSPFSIMILLGGIKTVPESLYEAAELDGVSAVQRFFHITLPLINPQLIMVLTLETIFAFKAFDQIYVATGGGPAGSTKTLMIYMIKDLFNQNYGMASALTVLLLLVLFCISLAQQLFLRKKVEY